MVTKKGGRKKVLRVGETSRAQLLHHLTQRELDDIHLDRVAAFLRKYSSNFQAYLRQPQIAGLPFQSRLRIQRLRVRTMYPHLTPIQIDLHYQQHFGLKPFTNNPYRLN